MFNWKRNLADATQVMVWPTTSNIFEQGLRTLFWIQRQCLFSRLMHFPTTSHFYVTLLMCIRRDHMTVKLVCNLRKQRNCFVWTTDQRLGARGSVVGWGTMLQAGRSRVRVPMRWYFFNLPNACSRTMALGSTQPLTEMSTRNIPGGKGRPACKADVTAICEPIV
jgi:hypothetical protein